jgi:SAM-dependent methyltransferase
MADRQKAPRNQARGPHQFDAEYYARFYGDPATRVVDAAAVQTLATFVAAYLRQLDVPVQSILDVGCGVGHWRTAAAKLWPTASYHGVEYSEYLCREYGFHHGSITDFDAAAHCGRDHFDLVVCQGVLQYLDDRQAARAIRNLAQWCDGALYLEALTARDWRHNCDRTRTDGNVHRRSGHWYRQRLRRHFLGCGGGVFASKRAGVTLFELEEQ